MATINVSQPQGGGHPSRHGPTNVPYTVEAIVDFAQVLAKNGTALAAADVVEALAVPAQSVVLTAGVEILAPADSTTLTLDVGVTGVDADVWVDGFDAKGAAGTYAQNPAAYQPIVVGNTADTVDVLFATLTGSLTAGKVRVFAVLLDVSDKKAPGVAVSTASA
jgi:hypothetical protein